MPLISGTRLGPFEIGAPLGAGGMGEVYRATDTVLGRQVAIKLLPDAFAADPERLVRFEREAKTLASLNHPNIAAIYGFEKSAGTHALVMELVEGDDLSQRIARGAIPLDDALPIAKQIAEALEAAHEHGIIHRDLKPANIKVRSDGTVKVLDFGLAKTLEQVPGSGPQAPGNLSQSPTITSPALMTGAGMILGTAAYMSPEQARGKAVDKRADIWAFGAVFYEMLTAKRAFEGEDVSETLAFILTKEPDWGALPSKTPANLRRLLRRCLTKDRKRRLADVADARLEIEDASAAPEAQADPAPVVSGSRTIVHAVPWIAALVFLATSIGLAVVLFRNSPVAQEPSVSFSLETPSAGTSPNNIAISPDGRFVAFAGLNTEGRRLLWLRPLNSMTSRALAGTDEALLPFWSPDSRFIGFFAGGKLKKIDVSGGPPQTLCDAASTAGGAWNREGVILFGGPEGLFRVSAAGGVRSVVTTGGQALGSHNHPVFLPDDRHFLFFARSPETGEAGIYLGELDTSDTSLVVRSDTKAEYVRPGYLLFVRENTLVAQPFNERQLVTTGEPFPVAEQVSHNLSSGVSAFSASGTGTLVYRTNSWPVSRLRWFDRTGQPMNALREEGAYRQIALSPDDARIAVHRFDPQFGTYDIWLVDIARDVSTRFTFDSAANEGDPVWSPDGRDVVFTSSAGAGLFRLYRKPVAGGDQILLGEGAESRFPEDWSRDGRLLAYNSPTGGRILGVLPLAPDAKPFVFLDSPFIKDEGHFSPDGRVLVYQSNESGQTDIYAQTFPGPGERVRVSSEGGGQPKWRADGRELFYLRPDGMLMSVSMKTDPRIEAGIPQPLFQTSIDVQLNIDQYAPTRDGQRFLAIEPVPTAFKPSINVVLNWPTLLSQ